MLSLPAVLVRYLRADGKLHSVNLQNSNLSDGRSHTLLLRVSGLKGSSLSLELYVDCKLLDSNTGLPEMAAIDQEKTKPVEVRTGQKTYLRLQVSRLTHRVPTFRGNQVYVHLQTRLCPILWVCGCVYMRTCA